uniref:BUB1 N-terminal domain-containing protein n=1 Tax=Labrus bergylta TaxID=56723 RepID=A0A3Q3FFZ4_9LABR
MCNHIYSKGIGTRTAALYVAWAQQFEQSGMNEQADAVYQRALENQAQPVDTTVQEEECSVLVPVCVFTSLQCVSGRFFHSRKR